MRRTLPRYEYPGVDHFWPAGVLTGSEPRSPRRLQGPADGGALPATHAAARAVARPSPNPAAPYHRRVAVIIASDLAKDMVGEPLFRKVSLSLERRDRW